jgi:hypothetical protein
MRLMLLLAVIALLAGVCPAADFKSDEAKKAQADYEAAIKAAKFKYGQELKTSVDALAEKMAAAGDSLAKEAFQKEADLMTAELVRLRDEVAGAAASEPKELKADAAKKAWAGLQVAQKAAKMKYTQDLVAVQRVLLARKGGAESAVKQALQQELDLIAGQLKQLREGDRSSPPKNVDEIVIDALIDAECLLHVTPTGLYWENIRFSRPGREGGRNEPTWVNEQSWQPEWALPPEAKGHDLSKPLALLIGKADFKLEVLSCGSERGKSGAAQGSVELQAAGVNQVVHFKDPANGAHWYRIRLFRVMQPAPKK